MDWPEGVFPRRAIGEKRIESKETIQGNKLQEPEDERMIHQTNNQRTKDEPSAKTTKDRLPTTTNPKHAFMPKKSREAFSKRKI